MGPGPWIIRGDSGLNVVAEIYVDNIKHSDSPGPPSSTPVEKPMIFIAPLQGEVDGQLIVSPISTMVHTSMQEDDVSFKVAKESVANEVGVPSNVLLTNYDVENPSPDQLVLQQQSADEIEKLELSMSYHDNFVYFDVPNRNSGGSFVVKDYYIPSAQDPDHHIQIGTVVPVDFSNSVLHFREVSLDFVLGRSGSYDAATWWRARVSANENIFNSEPEKLNFAMKGDLTLIFSGNTYFLKGFYIAQGHVLHNNWWIGSKDCSYGEDFQTIHCSCTDGSGNPTEIWFSVEDNDTFGAGSE